MSFEPIQYGPQKGQYIEPHRGTLVLVLGILGLVMFAPLGIAAWILGGTDLKKMREGRMDRSGESATQAGYVLGIIASILCLMGCLVGLLWFAFFIVVVAAGVAGAH